MCSSNHSCAYSLHVQTGRPATSSNRSPSPLREGSDDVTAQFSPLPCKRASTSPASAGVGRVWQKLVTQEGKFYYHDTVNNRTQWTPPPELHSVRCLHANFIQMMQDPCCLRKAHGA